MNQQRRGSTARARSSSRSNRSGAVRSAPALCLLIAALGLAGCGSDEGGGSAAPEPPQENASRSAGSGVDQARPATGDGRGGVALEEIGSFASPLYVAQPPGVREAIYVVEQGGRIIRVAADGSTSAWM